MADTNIAMLPITGKGYPIPDAALDDRLGWIGTSGSGKTYNAGGGVERLLASGARVVIVDPLGVWWGLRLATNGSDPSPFDVAIFGGPRGDLPLNEHAGALIGETAATMAESCIIDLSELGSKAADRRFMVAFLETIYRKANGRPFHLVVDEADLFAPQKPQKGDEVLLGHMENIVRRGRIKGFIPWLISQRPAVLNKNVLSQVDGLIGFKLTASQDRNALDAWIEGQADVGQGKAIKDALPAFEIGQGVVWLPGRGVLEMASFPLKRTFDSSRTPKRGEKVAATASLKPLDLGALKERLASVETEAKANDPKALKAEIARLTRELAATQKGGAPAWPDQRKDVTRLVAELEEMSAAADRLTAGAAELQRRQKAALAALVGESVSLPVVSRPQARPSPAPAPVQRQPSPVREPRQSEGDDALTRAQRRILDALAWWRAFGIAQPTNEQVGFIAGYAPGSGNFNNLKGGLRSAGLIEYPVPGKVALTPDGEHQAATPSLELTQSAFHAQVRAKLSAAQVRLLDPALAAYPDEISSQEVADAAGYAAGSGNFNNLRGSLRTIGLIDYPSPGQVRASDWLFP
jgi:hypothetical protein